MTMATGERVGQAAGLILEAWRRPRAVPLDAPTELRPGNLAQAYGIQQAVSTGLGAVGGWRVCRMGSRDGPACAPLPLGSLHPEPGRVPANAGDSVRLRAGICFRLGASLPDYDAPYTRQQVLAAIESCHPGVDVLRSRFAGPDTMGALSAIANGCGHERLVYGHATPGWSEIDVGEIPISVLQGGGRSFSQVARLAEDAIGLLRWLANEGSRRGGGLMVRQLVMIDIGTEEICIPVNQPARIVLGRLGAVSLRFI